MIERIEEVEQSHEDVVSSAKEKTEEVVVEREEHKNNVGPSMIGEENPVFEVVDGSRVRTNENISDRHTFRPGRRTPSYEPSGLNQWSVNAALGEKVEAIAAENGWEMEYVGGIPDAVNSVLSTTTFSDVDAVLLHLSRVAVILSKESKKLDPSTLANAAGIITSAVVCPPSMNDFKARFVQEFVDRYRCQRCSQLRQPASVVMCTSCKRIVCKECLESLKNESYIFAIVSKIGIPVSFCPSVTCWSLCQPLGQEEELLAALYVINLRMVDNHLLNTALSALKEWLSDAIQSIHRAFITSSIDTSNCDDAFWKIHPFCVQQERIATTLGIQGDSALDEHCLETLKKEKEKLALVVFFRLRMEMSSFFARLPALESPASEDVIRVARLLCEQEVFENLINEVDNVIHRDPESGSRDLQQSPQVALSSVASYLQEASGIVERSKKLGPETRDRWLTETCQ